jgi:hypothetical protein
VNPLVPILRNPRLQYIKLKIRDPRAMAPIYASDSKCPINAISTIPSMGMEMLLMMLGMARSRIFLFNLQKF